MGTEVEKSICGLCAQEFHLPRSMRQDERRLQPGEVLYATGQVADAVYLIESGTLDLFVDGSTAPIRSAKAGELLGILAITSNGFFVRTARARAAVTFYRIPRQQFLDYLHGKPDLWMQIVTVLDHEANNALAALSRSRATAIRVAETFASNVDRSTRQ